MFEELSSRFEDAVKGLRGEAKISENNINETRSEINSLIREIDLCISQLSE